MNTNKNYIIATIKSWHNKEFENIKEKIKGNFFLINDISELNLENLNKINPRYIFFPHWSNKVPDEILNIYECVCFHETDLPFGRGGSPIQNLINEGFQNTKISALRMNNDFDTGPIYLKKDLSLHGLAEEIFIRSAKIIAQMIEIIILEEPIPVDQKGITTIFKRRDPSQSLIPENLDNLEDLFNFIRMLDAESYPLAKLIYNKFEIEFSRPALRTGRIEASVSIKKIN